MLRLCLAAAAAIGPLSLAACGGTGHSASIARTDGRPEPLVSRSQGYGLLQVMTDDGRTKVVYKSNDACCSNVVAISSRLVAFDDDYNVKTVDVDDGRVDRIAGFSNFVVSPDGRWLAGWAESGGHGPETIGVVSADGATCLAVPKPKNADDFDPSFSADGKRLFFTRRRFDPHTRTPEHRLSVLLSALPRSRQAC